jgi:hypothetical protein
MTSCIWVTSGDVRECAATMSPTIHDEPDHVVARRRGAGQELALRAEPDRRISRQSPQEQLVQPAERRRIELHPRCLTGTV